MVLTMPMPGSRVEGQNPLSGEVCTHSLFRTCMHVPCHHHHAHCGNGMRMCLPPPSAPGYAQLHWHCGAAEPNSKVWDVALHWEPCRFTILGSGISEYSVIKIWWVRGGPGGASCHGLCYDGQGRAVRWRGVAVPIISS